jgi:hypothetical protein
MGSIGIALEVYQEKFPGKIKIKTINQGEVDTEMKGTEGGSQSKRKDETQEPKIGKNTETKKQEQGPASQTKNEKKDKRKEENNNTGEKNKNPRLRSLFTMVGTRKKMGNGVIFVS